MTGGRTGGHVLPNLSKVFNFYFYLTLSNCVIKCKVTGKRITIKELDMDYKFRSSTIFLLEKAVNWAEKSVKKVIDSVEKRTKKCTK